MAAKTLLIGDIGGTNARFALADDKTPGFSWKATLQCANFASADLAIRQYLKDIGAKTPDVICLAAAGPIVEQRVRFTNNPWSIAAAEMAEDFSISRVRLLNDFEAIAYSIPFLGDGECLPFGLPGPEPLDEEHYTVGILGPGTGLGAVGLRKHGELLIPIARAFALALGADDGVFIAGGIVRRYPELLENSRFRSGFESKGRHRSLMERVPTHLILHEQPGLLGASYCAIEMLRKAA